MPRVAELAEVSGHGADVVRNQDAKLLGGQRQNRRIFQASQSSGLSSEEIQCGLPSQNSRDDRLVEIGVREEPYFHDGLEVCNWSRARVSLSRRFAGRGLALRLPCVHFLAWLTRYASMRAWLAK